MLEVETPASEPLILHPDINNNNNNNNSSYDNNDNNSSTNLQKPEYFVAIVFALAVLFSSLYLQGLPSTRVPQLRSRLIAAAITGAKLRDGEVWHINRHQTRRRRSTWSDAKWHGVRGLARDCGFTCYFRLRQDTGDRIPESELHIHLTRWKQLPQPNNKSLPTLENNRIRPIVQFMDSVDATHARMSRFVPDCLYSAHVKGATESSIVNLCDISGGLFGTLVLPDGTYLIEPVKDDQMPSKPSSSRAHIVYKSRSHSFHKYGFPSSSSTIIATTPFLTIAPTATFANSYSTSNYRTNNNNNNDNNNNDNNNNDNNDDNNNNSINDVQTHNYTAYRISNDNANYDNSTAQYTTIFDPNINITDSWFARSRRSANSWDHYVEVLVVADNKMLLYHQNNLENYVLTLFSTVASIYRHPSLRAAINIIVTRLIVLKHEAAGPHISDNAQDTLQQFCRWQETYNDKNDDAPNHHDVAILLTRHDICRAPGKCDTLGLAELGTMCDSLRSCAIIEDNGLSAAFTITHELGHIFNIPHDDERKCGRYMALNKHNYHIMAPTLEYNTHPWSWSPCSAAMLAKFLDANRAQTQCILDQPIERRYYDRMFEDPAPGAMFSANQQCQFVFGPSAELCPYMPACRRLWCATYYGYQMGCRTQHMPWADGTPCGDNQWCHRGECVGMAPQQRAKLDGSWGEWKNWGDCSRTCGGGVQKALRDCDNPRPSNGGKYCVGQRERYRPCNIQDCPWDTPGFREVQCSEFDNQDVGIHGVPPKSRWLPKYTGVSDNEKCKLYCRVSGSAAFYLLKDKVLDGTPCYRHGDDMCIDGTCHKAGCDHRLGSEMRRDKCGICGGNGSTCRVVSGSYNERGSFGYNEVLKIPAGSANIEITQHGYHNQKEDDNYLALRNANGEFLLNGHYQVSVFRQQISIQDAVLEYSGSDHVIERINGTGPIRTDIYLHVLSVGNLYPPDIHYEFMVPAQNVRFGYEASVTNYYWRISERWSECSSLCQGQQKQELICVDAISSRGVNDNLCISHRPPTETRMCNIDCTIKWRVIPIGQCNATCGRGEKRQKSECIRSYVDGRETVISDSHCHQLKKPSDRAQCYVDCSGRKWIYTEWTSCSATCGTSGINRRQAFCIDHANRRLDDRACEQAIKEKTEKECNRMPCPKWVYGSWSECSRSCDGGVKVRHASCQDAAGREVHSTMCNSKEKHDWEKCNEQICTQWKFGAWGSCSVSCGDGIETRDAVCTDLSGRTLDQSLCDRRERIVQKPCHRMACPSWHLGSWSVCSVSCLDGWKTRHVSCVDANGNEVSDEQCLRQGEARPQSHQPCNQGPCPFWRTSDWTKCSVSCGVGVRARNIECIYRDQVVDGSLCSDTHVAKIEQCSLLPCARWKVLPWSHCSVTCGTGQQIRTVQCLRGKSIVHESECDIAIRPKTEKICERDNCEVFTQNVIDSTLSDQPKIRWAIGPWSDCSRTCGNGTQRRLVVCRDHIRDLIDTYCQHLEPIETIRYCQIKPCAQWTVGPWKSCSVTCGVHATTDRRVSCESVEGNEQVRETDCDVAIRPQSIRSCNLNPCPMGEPPLGSWITKDWEKCSVSCGGGWRRRLVTCSTRFCNEEKKPEQFDRCNQQKCVKVSNVWQMSPWSHCSVTCGGGVQKRTVWCEDEKTRERIQDRECLLPEKPTSIRECNEVECQAAPVTNEYYHWYAGKWSPVRTNRRKYHRIRGK
ncbi:Thrombospondin type 1 domain family protein [Acanthocheilonema viteae]